VSTPQTLGEVVLMLATSLDKLIDRVDALEADLVDALRGVQTNAAPEVPGTRPGATPEARAKRSAAARAGWHARRAERKEGESEVSR
jgi:hypothetical protein